ncbi:MAG: helix-turn-helix transcriptional regulator [Clostridia bacterium]|nr:helix-turn-helix transcriptional regulator [Clostridia bacterium]
MKKVGENLKLTRVENNKSIYDIEKELKISHQNLYKWEKGQSEPSIINCIKLADYYGISLDELVGREK